MHICSKIPLLNPANCYTCVALRRLQSVPLVCRAWRDAHASPGRCWDALEIDGLRLTKGPPMCADAAQRFWRLLAAWLPRRAGGLRQLRLANLRHLLQALEDAGRLAALAQLWRPLGAARAASLPAATALRALEVGRSSVGLAPGTVAAMACLPQLRVLRLHSASPLDFSELDSLADGLPCLEELHVCLMRRRGELCAFRGAFPARLAGLRSLRSLQLEAPHSPLHAPRCALPEALHGWSEQVGGMAVCACACVCCSVCGPVCGGGGVPEGAATAWGTTPRATPHAPRPTLGSPPLRLSSPAAPPLPFPVPLLAHLPTPQPHPRHPLPASWRCCTNLTWGWRHTHQPPCSPLTPTPPHPPTTRQLEELHLINLGLEALPASVGGLRRLRELCLGRNRLGLAPAALPWDLTQARRGCSREGW